MSEDHSWVVDPNLGPIHVTCQSKVRYEDLVYMGIDEGVRDICRALWRNEVDTRWSCSGRSGHLCSRPTIIIPAEEVVQAQDDALKKRIEAAMAQLGIEEYWLSRVYSHVPSSSGMQHFWMLELPNWRVDYLAYPVGFRGVSKGRRRQP